MRIKLLWIILLLINVKFGIAQDNLTSYLTLSQKLTENANAVIRLDETNVAVNAVNDVTITEKRIVTVLNENGVNKIGAVVWYSNNTKVKSAEVIIYDKFGSKIKKIRKNDFQDVSAVNGATMYSDYRMKYIDYTPIAYPFTAVFTSTIETSNSSNLPPFFPISYYTGVEKSTYTITYPASSTLYKKELNLEEFGVEKIESEGKLTYTIKNIPGVKPESYSPTDSKIEPQVRLALSKFSYEGIDAKVSNWEEIGLWIHQNLIKGRAKVDLETKAIIEKLTAGVTSDREKAKIVYEYVQNKTRYISVQVGIGGYQPIPADEVDSVGYGDCKGLTNYTMALLKIVGVESYYTVVKSGSEIISFYDDFASLGQGDHVILNIPNNGDDIWLECTSQKVPFGHIGDFTDDRNVLVVTPEGGQLKHTKKYSTEENFQETTGSYSLNNDGNITADVTIETKGIQYDNRYSLEDWSEVKKDKHYKKYWFGVSNINVDEINHENDKETITFYEKVKFKADAYGVLTGDRMLFAPNALNRYSNIPDRYRNRRFPLEISRGFYDTDSYEIKLPADYKIEALPNNVVLETKFGSYSFTITKKDDQTLVYERTIKIEDGFYPKEEYKNYRKFLKKIVKLDNSKVVLVKK
jgi:transglutaminase-like putative cysteine protease